jgi:hypothetical protein
VVQLEDVLGLGQHPDLASSAPNSRIRLKNCDVNQCSQ